MMQMNNIEVNEDNYKKYEKLISYKLVRPKFIMLRFILDISALCI